MGNKAGVVSEEELVTVVVVGVTGVGKSTLCNAITGSEVATVREGFSSGTTQPAHFDVTRRRTSCHPVSSIRGLVRGECLLRQRIPLRVVDTVGFLSNHTNEAGEDEADTSTEWWLSFLSTGKDEQQPCGDGDADDMQPQKFEELTAVSIFGIDCFLYVERYGRFTEESGRHFKVFSDLVGPEALRHTVVVFTHVSTDTLAEAMREEDLPTALRDMEKQVHSVIGVDCVVERRKSSRVLLEAVQGVVAANDGVRYRSDELGKMQAKRQDLAARIARLRRVDRREALRRQHKELQNGLRTYAELVHAIEDAEAAERLNLVSPSCCLPCRGLLSSWSLR